MGRNPLILYLGKKGIGIKLVRVALLLLYLNLHLLFCDTHRYVSQYLICYLLFIVFGYLEEYILYYNIIVYLLMYYSLANRMELKLTLDNFVMYLPQISGVLIRYMHQHN